MMVDSTIENLSNLFPSVIGWYSHKKGTKNYIHFNSLTISIDPMVYPLQARIKVYSPTGSLISDFYTDIIKYFDHLTVCLDDYIKDDFDGDGMYEVTTFSLKDEGLSKPYYNESWASIISDNGDVEVNYPMLITRGASPSQVDASTLYYPGIIKNDVVDPALLVVNHQTFDVSYAVSIYSADGKIIDHVEKIVKSKTIDNIRIEKLFQRSADVFSNGAGMLIFHFTYKLNAYVLTYHAKTGYLYGMDHMGVMFTAGETLEDVKLKRASAQVNRKCDKLICYCLGISKSDLLRYKDNGEDVVTTIESTKAGKVCQGCIPDIEAMFSQKIPN